MTTTSTMMQACEQLLEAAPWAKPWMPPQQPGFGPWIAGRPPKGMQGTVQYLIQTEQEMMRYMPSELDAATCSQSSLVVAYCIKLDVMLKGAWPPHEKQHEPTPLPKRDPQVCPSDRPGIDAVERAHEARVKKAIQDLTGIAKGGRAPCLGLTTLAPIGDHRPGLWQHLGGEKHLG